MESRAQDLVGQTLGACTLEKLIGQGGMGSVYLARQARPQRNVAVKVLLPSRSMSSQGNQDFLARFRREADVIAKLEHVNIMPIYEYGEKAGLAYLVMPYLSGGSLRELLSKQGSLSLEAAAAYIDQAASALDYAHAHGVIHRDLKPANFLLHADGRLVLADFGIARIMDEQTQGSTLTGVGTLLGTPEYMAPEMARGEQIDYRADIYELGIVLFQMLAGYVPFSGATPYAIVYKHVQQALPLLQNIDSSIPPAVDAVIQKATAKNREERYTTVRAMAQALHTAISASALVSYVGVQDQSAVAVVSPPPLVLPPPVRRTRDLAQADYYPSSSTNLRQTPGSSYNTRQTPDPSHNYMPLASLVQPEYQPPYQSAYQSFYQPPPRKQHTWSIVLAVMFVLVIAVGVLFAAARLNGGRVAANNPSAHSTVVVEPTATQQQPTPAPQPTSASVATPPPNPAVTGLNLPADAQLYASSAPGCNDGTGQWLAYSGVQVNCQGGSAQIINTSQKEALQGVFLTKVSGRTYSSNYIEQVRIQPDQGSAGSFGLYFRNQHHNQLGTYTFLMNAGGQWVVNVYDNDTGVPTQLAQGTVNPLGQNGVQMAVSVKGTHFSFYINGQRVGKVDDETYSAGTGGVTVGAGTSITATNYTLSRNIL